MSKNWSQLARTLAPYVPTPDFTVRAMMALVRPTVDDVFVDVGSGDARLVRAAARYGARSIGIEREAEYMALGRRALRREPQRVKDLVELVEADVFSCAALLSRATIVSAVLTTEGNAELQEFLTLTLRRGTRVVGHSYAIPGWQPVRMAEGYAQEIFLYEIGKSNA